MGREEVLATTCREWAQVLAERERWVAAMILLDRVSELAETED